MPENCYKIAEINQKLFVSKPHIMTEIKKLSSTLSPEEQYKILSRGVVDLINKEEFLKKLKLGRPLRVKAGFDPSKPDLHLGHSSLINKMRQFQELGHEIIFVVGDFTACIGDPSGQNKTRPMLSYNEARENAKSYIQQATESPSAQEAGPLRESGKTSISQEANSSWENGKAPIISQEAGSSRENGKAPIISQEERDNFKKEIDRDEKCQQALLFFKRLDPKKTKHRYNSEWLKNVSLKEFIMEICSKLTVAQLLERKDFFLRSKEEDPIGLHEFLYPLIQAYDSLALKADVELGGTDQLFNLLRGRALQEQIEQEKRSKQEKNWKESQEQKKQEPQIVLTLPLLEGTPPKWEFIHDLKAYLVYIKIKEGGDKKRLCEDLSQDEDFKNHISLNSIKMKIENYRYLDTGEGLAHVSQQSKDIFVEFKDSSQSEIEETIKREEVFFNKFKNASPSEIEKTIEKEIKEKRNEQSERKFKNLKWNLIHDLKAYLVYRKIKEGGDKKRLCEDLSQDEYFKNHISLGSIKLKIENYRYLDTKEGLSHFSKQSKYVFNEFKDSSLPEIEKEIKKIERKMSKSLGNAISFNDSSTDIYGKTMNISDELLVRWWNLFTEGRADLEPSFANKSLDPKREKEKLAWVLVCSFHGEDKAHQAREEFNRVFSGQRGLPDQILENQNILNKSHKGLKNHKNKNEQNQIMLEQNQDLLKKNKNLLEQTKDLLKQNEELREQSQKKEIKLYQLIRELELSSSASEARKAVLAGAVKAHFRWNVKAHFKWKFIHDLKAYLVYRKVKEGGNKGRLCWDLSQDEDFKDYISLGSIKMKIENYRYLEIGEGLGHFSQQSKDVFDKFEKCSLSQIEEEVKKINTQDSSDFTQNSMKLTNPDEKTSLEQKDEILFGMGKRKGRVNLKWKLIHDLKAYLVYRKIKEGGDKERLCRDLSQDEDFKNHISLGSIKMKVENYRYLGTKKEGLSGFSRQSEQVFKSFKNRSLSEVEEEVKKVNTQQESEFIQESMKLTNPDDKIPLEQGDEILFSLGKRKFKRVNLKWELIHDLKAYLVYRQAKEGGEEHYHQLKENFCKQLSQDEDFKDYISLSSIMMKVENYRYLDTGEGLSGFSRQSEGVFNKFKNDSLSGIEEAIKKEKHKS